MSGSSFWGKFDHWANEGYRPSLEFLGLYRILYGLISLFLIGTHLLMPQAEMPQYIFAPWALSLPAMIGDFPSYELALAVSFSALALYVALIFGYRTRVLGVILTILLIASEQLFHVYGKFNHGNLFAQFMPGLLAFAGWGDRFSIDERQGRAKRSSQGWPISLLAVLLGFAFFTSGFVKIMGGWLSLNSCAVESIVFTFSEFREGRGGAFASLFLSIDNTLFYEALDYSVPAFEMLFLWAAFRPKLFRVFLVAAYLFHLGNYLLMAIPFIGNMILYVLFFDWDSIFGKARLSRIGRAIGIFSDLRAMLAFGILALAMFGLYVKAFPYEQQFALYDAALVLTRLEGMLPSGWAIMLWGGQIVPLAVTMHWILRKRVS